MNPKEIDKLNKGRVFRQARSALEPTLMDMKSRLVSKLLAKFNSEDHNYLSTVAEINVITNILHEINKHEREAQRIEEKIYGNAAE